MTTTKSQRTRELLVDTALGLFRERGYEATTMRLIAAQAGVSPGSAYYYFEGKDALVQELYQRIQQEHRERALPLLVAGAPLSDNLRTTWHSGLDTMAPYHGFGATLLQVALSRSSVSPFSPASAAPREAATSLLRDVLDSSRGIPRGALGERLPHLLWLAYLGVTLHWVTDTSLDQKRTRTLVDGVAPILSSTIRLARLPVGRALVADVITLTDQLTTDESTTPHIDRRTP